MFSAEPYLRTGAIFWPDYNHLAATREIWEVVGVRYRRDGRAIEVHADGEVLLAAGSINTPKLLELSGVGRPDILTASFVARPTWF